MRTLHLLSASAAALATVSALPPPAHAGSASADNFGAAPPRFGTGRYVWTRLHGLLPRAPSTHRNEAAPGAPPPTAPTLNFVFLDFPGSTATYLVRSNIGATPHAKLRVVGDYGADIGGAFQVDLTTKGGTMSESYTNVLPGQAVFDLNGINDDGVLVGTLAADVDYGFVLRHGKLTQIYAPYNGVNFTSANGINDSGVVVGAWSSGSDLTSHGFLWKNGVFTQIPDYPSASNTWPWDINSAGDMTGYIIDSNGNDHGFLLKNGVYTVLDFPGAAYTNATGINDSDEIVGAYCITVQDCSLPFNGVHGFLYSNGTYTTIDVPGVPVNSPGGINNGGTIAGNYTDVNGFTHGYLVTPQ